MLIGEATEFIVVGAGLAGLAFASDARGEQQACQRLAAEVIAAQRRVPGR